MRRGRVLAAPATPLPRSRPSPPTGPKSRCAPLRSPAPPPILLRGWRVADWRAESMDWQQRAYRVVYREGGTVRGLGHLADVAAHHTTLDPFLSRLLLAVGPIAPPALNDLEQISDRFSVAATW